MQQGAAVAVSPGAQEIALTPGEVYEGSFTVLNPFVDSGVVSYHISVAPMSVEDEQFSLDFDDFTDTSQIVDWVELETVTGTLDERASATINYKIAVPADAPAGGQYAAFLVRAESGDAVTEANSIASIRSTTQVAMLLYSTVAGETRVEGTVLENNISPVYLDSPVKTSVFLSNTGNVHARAGVTLRVYPLFSDEEIYSTEEQPNTTLVLPNARAYSEMTWEETPQLGLFRIEQEVDYAGLYTRRTQTVLVAPVWFIVLAVLFLLAVSYAIVERVFLYKTRRKNPKKVQKRP